jgi:hypothetical protein
MARHVVLLLLAALAPATAAAGEIGVAAAVVPDAHGVPEGGADEALQTGSHVYGNERITSGPTGRVQLLFADGTSLNVGAGSDLVLDRYVYDPDRDAGEMTATMGKGVLRFVGGRISKKQDVVVNTPVGTVGIRGGIAAVSYEPGGELVAVFLYGEAMTVLAGGASQTVRRPGLAIRVAAHGPPGPPHPVAPGELGGMMGRLEMGPPRGGPRGERPGPPPRDGGAIERRVAGFGATAAMVAPLPGRPGPGGPPGPGPRRPGARGPAGQPPPGAPPGGAGGPLPPPPLRQPPPPR